MTAPSDFSFLVSRFSFLVSRFSFLVSRFSFLVSRFSFLVSRSSFLGGGVTGPLPKYDMLLLDIVTMLASIVKAIFTPV